MKIKIVFYFAIQILCFKAMAENWLSVGDNIYVDLSTQKREGDIGIVYVKYKGEGAFREFDCKNRIFIKLPELDISKHNELQKTMDLA